VRSWLLEHDELPAELLVVQMPVSVRTDEQMGTFGRTHTALAAMKEHHRALPAELLQDTNHFIPQFRCTARAPGWWRTIRSR
jgi:diacylglycerol O-acyltransferase / wax synthase